MWYCLSVYIPFLPLAEILIILLDRQTDTMCTPVQWHTQSPHSRFSRCWAEPRGLTWTTCSPCSNKSLPNMKYVPIFTLSHTNVPVSWQISQASCYLSKLLKVFPRPSSTDSAEGMIIEVDAPLWRSHYDWFWPDEGWEAPASCSSRSHEIEKDNNSKHLEANTEAHSEKQTE